jgi:Tol biopolymer transport system component
MDHRQTLTTALSGRYEIAREIGAGGMAVVYLARDVKHNRNVALKVLNPELGAVLGAERFLAEIQVTANLQHPNLLPLFDSGEAEGLLFYVMPYVEGESLRVRLEREKQLPVDEAVRIASAIAGALDYAHRHNVIHRDLKPENILMQEGQPLIADFGIALAVTKAGGARITQTGLSLGTPQYMSPEQATGDRVVDGRTDIYSLSAMTYEMLVGDPPHTASTAQAIVAKVLTEKPRSVHVGRPNVPAHVDYAVARGLEKLAADRFESAKEFSEALNGKGVAVSHASATGPASQRSPVAARELAAWGALVMVAAAFAWNQLKAPGAGEQPVVRALLDVPTGARIDPTLAGSSIAVSPAGDFIAYNARTASGSTALFIRRTDGLDVREVVRPRAGGVGARNITFSPRGDFLAFSEGNVIYKVPTDGGQAITVGTVSSVVSAVTPYGLSWAEDDTIYVGNFSGLVAIPAAGGQAVLLGTRDSVTLRTGARWPLALANGRSLLFVSGRTASDNPRLGVYDLRSGLTTQFGTEAAAPLGFIDDRLVYVTPDGTIMAIRFDQRAARPEGTPVPVEEGVVVDQTVGAKAALSRTGTLAYLRGRAEQQPVIVRRDASLPIPLIEELHVYTHPRFSPEGDRVAITVTSKGSTDIWVYNIPRNTFQRLTTEGMNVRPEWSPDGKRVVFRSERGGKAGIWWQPADGSGPAELLHASDDDPFEAIISPDAKWLIYRTGPGFPHYRDIFAVPMQGEKRPLPLATGPGTELMPRLSPNGKWLAYQSTVSGRFQVYVRPFPGNGAVTQVSVTGGTEPVWSPSGTELLYRDPEGPIISVKVTTGTTFSIGERRPITSAEYVTDASHANYDVARDGRLLMLRRAGEEAKTIIVHNWIREFRAKTAAKR